MGIKARTEAAQAPKGTTYYLWELHYEVQIPQMANYSDDYLRMYGMPTSGNPQIDAEMAQQWIHTWKTPAEMIEFHRKGVPVRIVHHKDTEAIYHHIQNHLQAWRNQVSKGLHSGLAPQKDLVDMDRFAEEIFGHARVHIKDTRPQGSFMRALDRKGHSDMSRALDKPTDIQEENDSVNRESLASIFKAVGARNKQPATSKNPLDRWM